MGVAGPQVSAQELVGRPVEGERGMAHVLTMIGVAGTAILLPMGRFIGSVPRERPSVAHEARQRVTDRPRRRFGATGVPSHHL